MSCDIRHFKQVAMEQTAYTTVAAAKTYYTNLRGGTFNDFQDNSGFWILAFDVVYLYVLYDGHVYEITLTRAFS